MGLKDLKSNLDLVAGNDPVGNMEGQAGPQSQLPVENASQAHIDSLQQVPGFSSNSPFQDLNGEQGPQSQLPIDDASQKHIDSLSQVPGGDQNSPFQDLNGEQGPSFDNGSDSTLQQDSLLQQYNYSHGGESGQGGPVPNTSPYQDLNGIDNGNGTFDNGVSSNLQQDSLVSLYQYQHGNSPESTGPSTLDLNGNVGPGSQLPIDDASQKHIDSLSQVPGFSSNSPFQDLNINLQQGTPGQYLNNMPD